MSTPSIFLHGGAVIIRHDKKDGLHQAIKVNIHDDCITVWSISGTLEKEPARIVIQNHPDVPPTIAQLHGGFTP